MLRSIDNHIRTIIKETNFFSKDFRIESFKKNLSISSSTNITVIDKSNKYFVKLASNSTFLKNEVQALEIQIKYNRRVIPEVLKHGSLKSTNNDFIIFEFLPYPNLNDYFKNNSIHKYIREIIISITQNLKKQPTSSRISAISSSSWLTDDIKTTKNLLLSAHQRFKRKDSTSPILLKYLPFLDNIVVKNDSLFSQDSILLCQGDLVFNNILVNPFNLSDFKIVDWEYAAYSSLSKEYGDLLFSCCCEHGLKLSNMRDLFETESTPWLLILLFASQRILTQIYALSKYNSKKEIDKYLSCYKVFIDEIKNYTETTKLML